MPGLRMRDLEHMPRLRALAERGAACELVPTFPCVTSPVQMNMLTGTTPDRHGIIGNGFYHRDRGAVEFWVGRNGLVECEQLWDVLARRGVSQAAWLPQNIKDAPADFIVTPEPIHHPDGRTDLWCYSKPDGLYERLLADLGHFPLMHFWGPMADLRSTEWIVNAALWLFQRERPRFNYVYIPHLDYAAQKHGPNSNPQRAACLEADVQLGRLLDGAAALGVTGAAWLVVGEYAMTDVSRVLYPNRILRDAGMVTVVEKDGADRLSIADSAAFAVVDHQFAHVYVKHAPDIDAVAGLFEGLDGIADVLRPQTSPRSGDAQRDEAATAVDYPIDHPRSGEVVLVCEPDTWLAYYWWRDDARAPPFARTVDIHNKPGYDPVELFIDPTTKQIPLDPTRVRGSHGAPARSPEQYAACIAGEAGLLPPQGPLRDSDVRTIVESALA